MAKFALGLGANLGNRHGAISFALQKLGAHPRIQLLAKAHLYETPPWGKKNQPTFLNTCAMVETSLSPIALLKFCQTIEGRLGRVRREHWGARTLDIDILWWSGRPLRTRDLTVPHPYLTKRAFALIPLSEIFPELIIARTPISSWISQLPTKDLQSLKQLR